MRRRRRKSAAKTVAIIVVLLGAGLFLAARLAFYQPPKPPQVTHEQARKAEATVVEIKTTLDSVRKNASRGRKVSFELRIPEDDLTNYAASNPEVKRMVSAMNMRDLRVKFDDGLAVFSGLTKYAGREVYVTVTGKPVPGAKGGVELTDVKANVGRLSAPFLGQKAKSLFDAMLRSGQANMPADVDTVEAKDGVLVLRGESRPGDEASSQ